MLFKWVLLALEAGAMTRPSNNLRKLVVRAHFDGEPVRSVVARFGVSVSSVPKWVASYRATGSIALGHIGGHRPLLLEPHRERVHVPVAATPHLTLERLQKQLASEGVTVCWDTTWRFLRREGLRFKNTQFALERMRTAVARKRARWREVRRGLEPDRLRFVDETWIRTNMAPLRDWAPKGYRLKGFASHGRWRTLTFLAGLRRDELGAPCVFNGPINRHAFQAWVEQHPVPPHARRPRDPLQPRQPQGQAARRAIRGAVARLWFLPPHLPDLNPIEQAFAKIKYWMRDARKRSVEDTWRRPGTLLATIEPQECRNYIRSAGYGSIYDGRPLESPRTSEYCTNHLATQLAVSDSMRAEWQLVRGYSNSNARSRASKDLSHRPC